MGLRPGQLPGPVERNRGRGVRGTQLLRAGVSGKPLSSWPCPGWLASFRAAPRDPLLGVLFSQILSPNGLLSCFLQALTHLYLV